MVLKQKRTNDDVLIIDASKGFIKEGKNNKLRDSDIKKIVDTFKNRLSIDKYSKVWVINHKMLKEYTPPKVQLDSHLNILICKEDENKELLKC